jgi:hypothetical protein
MGFLSSLFGIGGRSKPSTQTVVQSQKLPPEIAPFVSEIAQEAKDLFQQRVGEGYTPYTGQTIAPLTPQQEAAMTGIEGLVGTSRPLQEEALGVTRQQAEKFTPETAEAYMSPYQRAVTDIEKREAERRFEREVLPRFEASAVQAGGMSGLGTRAGVEAAELQRGQSQLIADIEAKGLQSAFKDARKAFEDQKQREAGMAGDIARTGPAMFASGIQESGALQRVGEERRDLGQSALDEAYFKFLEERQFPEQTLADYSGFIYGNPLTQMGTTTKTQTGTPFQPSLGQTLLGIGSTLGASALRNPNITKNLFSKEGGQIARNRGLSGLPMFRRQENGQVIDEEGEESVEFIQTIKDVLRPLSKSLDRQKEESAERLKLGLEKAPHQRQRIWDFLTKRKSDPEAIATREALARTRKAQTDFEQGLVKSREDADLLETATERAGDSEGLPGDFQEGAVEEVKIEDDVEINLSTRTAEDKSNKKKIMKDIANRPSEGKLISMTVEEAAAKYDANPAAFGDMTREQYLKDTADYNKKYMDIINRIYPEAQNEFLADALQALGAMFVAENKGEAFIKTFNDLQKAGMKRRDARRIALGKAGLENLKSDKATLDKIRQLPKQRRDAINEMIKRREEQIDRVGTRKYRERMGIKAEEIGKFYKRKPATTPKTAASPRSVTAPEKDLGNSLLKTPSFFQGALGKYNIPSTVLSKTGVTNPEQVRKLIELTLEKESVRDRIMSQAKTIQAQKSGKGGTTVGFEQALEAATSMVLQNIYDSGRITFDDGIIYDSVEGLDN